MGVVPSGPGVRQPRPATPRGVVVPSGSHRSRRHRFQNFNVSRSDRIAPLRFALRWS